MVNLLIQINLNIITDKNEINQTLRSATFNLTRGLKWDFLLKAGYLATLMRKLHKF